jgi:hypothetical protein
MDQRGEANFDQCNYNDFALVQLDPADYASVNPTLRSTGGPTGLVANVLDQTDVFGSGTSIGPAGLAPHTKRGVSLRQGADGLAHSVRLSPPGISGDSGAGVVDANGRAFGVLSTYSPRRGTNGVGNLSRMLDYMRASGGPEVTLANGTEPFIAGSAAPQDPIGALLNDLLGGLLAPLAPR